MVLCTWDRNQERGGRPSQDIPQKKAQKGEFGPQRAATCVSHRNPIDSLGDTRGSPSPKSLVHQHHRRKQKKGYRRHRLRHRLHHRLRRPHSAGTTVVHGRATDAQHRPHKLRLTVVAARTLLFPNSPHDEKGQGERHQLRNHSSRVLLAVHGLRLRHTPVCFADTKPRVRAWGVGAGGMRRGDGTAGTYVSHVHVSHEGV